MLVERLPKPQVDSSLMYTWVIINTTMLALEFLMYYYGVWGKFFADDYGFTQIIVVTGHVIVGATFFAIRWMGRIEYKWHEIVDGKLITDRKQIDELLGVLFSIYSLKVFWVRRSSSILIILGLMGTIIGLIIAIQDSFTATNFSDSDAVVELVTQLFSGISVMFKTTLAGMVFYLWSSVILYVVDHRWSRFVDRVLINTTNKAG